MTNVGESGAKMTCHGVITHRESNREDLAVKYDLHLTGHVLSKGNKSMLELMLMLLAFFLTQEMRTTAAKFAWVGGGRCCCVSGSKVMG